MRASCEQKAAESRLDRRVNCHVFERRTDHAFASCCREQFLHPNREAIRTVGKLDGSDKRFWHPNQQPLCEAIDSLQDLKGQSSGQCQSVVV
jgi:hypothetical protein